MIVKRVPKTWDELPTDVIAAGEMFDTTALRKRHDELVREVKDLKHAVAQRECTMDLQERRIKVLEALVAKGVD